MLKSSLQVSLVLVLLLLDFPASCGDDVSGSKQSVQGLAWDADANSRLLDTLEKQGGHDEVTKRALATARNLQNFMDVMGSMGQAVQWAQQTTEQISNQVVGVQEAAQLFQSSDVYTQKGMELSGQAWTSMLDLSQKMTKTFDGFKPLQPAFASKDGVAQLATNPGNFQTLVHSVREIVSSNSVLGVLGNALESLCQIFTQIKDTLTSIISKLSGSSRRLSQEEAPALRRLQDYNQLLSGINFDQIGATIQGFVGKIKTQAEDLTDIDTILGPMLAKMDKNASLARRLSIIEDAQKDSRAISKIIPTWQAVEQTAVDMCPSVLSTKDTVGNLQCRTTQFASQAVLPTWMPGQVADIVGNCPADLPDAAKAVELGCPKQAYSSDLKNVLGENSQALGWSMALYGALGGGAALGLGGAGFAHALITVFGS